MRLKTLIIKYYLVIKILLIIIAAFVLFSAYFFDNTQSPLETLKHNFKNPMMYLCFIISFLVSVWITNGIFNKKKLGK